MLAARSFASSAPPGTESMSRCLAQTRQSPTPRTVALAGDHPPAGCCEDAGVQEMGAPASEQDAAMRLFAVLRRAPLVMEALRAARAVDAPDWLLNAGAIRDGSGMPFMAARPRRRATSTSDSSTHRT